VKALNTLYTWDFRCRKQLIETLGGDWEMKSDARRYPELIGGYATGTLTEAERAILFEAALDDQEIVRPTGERAGMKELLDEPGAKQRLIAALGGGKPRLRGEAPASMGGSGYGGARGRYHRVI